MCAGFNELLCMWPMLLILSYTHAEAIIWSQVPWTLLCISSALALGWYFLHIFVIFSCIELAVHYLLYKLNCVCQFSMSSYISGHRVHTSRLSYRPSWQQYQLVLVSVTIKISQWHLQLEIDLLSLNQVTLAIWHHTVTCAVGEQLWRPVTSWSSGVQVTCCWQLPFSSLSCPTTGTNCCWKCFMWNTPQRRRLLLESWTRHTWHLVSDYVTPLALPDWLAVTSSLQSPKNY